MLYRTRKKLKKRLLLLIFIPLLLCYFLFVLPFQRISREGRKIATLARELKSVFSQNDIDVLNKKTRQLALEYQQFEKAARTVYWASFIPYIADFKNAVEAGRYIINAVGDSIEAVAPYADLIGFKKGESSFVEKTAEDRLHTAVLTLDKLVTKIDPISENIKQAESRLEKIQPGRYPKKIGSRVVRERIVQLKEQFKSISTLFVDAKPLIKRLPEVLGKEGERNYLILFQNDKELRATGGFLTAYAVFNVNNGKIKIKSSEDIYFLDDSINVHPNAPREIATYHLNVPKFYIRDSNLSPDVPSSIKLFNSLYEKKKKKIDYNGLFLVDTQVLVDMLTIFGDTEASGVVFSAKADERCNCPQVIYKLFDIVDRPTPYLRENRKGILGDLMYALFYKALGFSPSKYWGPFVQTMMKNMQEKHILVYFVDKDLQQAVENLNFAGRIKPYEGDYLHINNVNFAGAKSNMFVTTAIISETNDREKKITVSFKNPFPHSDCNLERGNLCLNATLRNWIRFYVPVGSKLLEFTGSTKKVQTYNDLGKTVFEGFLTVDPLKTAKVVIRYSLPSLKTTKKYLIQKQPGTYSDKLTVKVDGKTVYDGVLDTDKEIQH